MLEMAAWARSRHGSGLQSIFMCKHKNIHNAVTKLLKQNVLHTTKHDFKAESSAGQALLLAKYCNQLSVKKWPNRSFGFHRRDQRDRSDYANYANWV